MELRGYKMETSLSTNEVFAKFTHYFSSKGWNIGRWIDAEIIAKDGRDINWWWLILIFIAPLTLLPFLLYCIIQERKEIRMTRGEGSIYYVEIKGKAKDEFLNFADSIKAIATPTYKGSKTTAGEIIMYLALILVVIVNIIVVLAFL